MSPVLSLVFRPVSWLYGAVMVFRNWCFDVGICRVERVSVPVISIGNLTAGGTGKTPFVEYLIRYFLDRGMSVSVLSRGYRRSTRGTVVVSDGETIAGTAATAGDEPYQIATKFPGAIVVVDEMRSRGARFILEKFRPNVILLDDGFQHQWLARDLDIVMVDGTKSLRDVQMLPSGLRREPLRSLRRADVIVVKDATEPFDSNPRYAQYSTAPVISVQTIPLKFRSFCTNEPIPLERKRGIKCVAFCGIGNPESFREVLENTGVSIRECMTFPDHYSYKLSDIRRIKQTFENTNAEFVVTTEKDAVRLRTSNILEHLPSQSILYLEVELKIAEGERILHQLLSRTVGKAA